MDELLLENEKLRQEILKLKEQLMRKKDSETVVQLACGLRHSLALFKDGTIKGWGDNTYGQSVAQSFLTEGKKAIQIACNQNYSMALLDDGTLRGWGNGLVTFDKTNKNLLEFPRFDQKVIRIICGGLSSCALLEDKRTVITWGIPINGEQDTTFVYGKDVKQIECGGMNYFIVLFEDGTIKIHGYFATPSLGESERLLNYIKENHKEIKRIACGWQFFLALSDKKFKAYGNYSLFGAEINSINDSQLLQYVEYQKKISHIGCGEFYCVIITDDNNIKIIGNKFRENYINLSSLTFSENYLRSDFEVESNVVHLACGPYHFTILLENGDFISHGLNDFGQCNKPAFLSNKPFEKKYLKYKNKYLQLK
jgi:alpha-tubulin suppressor-like RCC1 family protein